ncbi:MAG: alpha/beta fold hydrolase [Cyclobacteriaceae bacterium]|nr:alpha/beta fold hydrolase [Cyclobacteriaceae bacterium]
MRAWFLPLLILLCSPLLCSGQSLKSYINGSLTLYYEEIGTGPALYILSGGPGEAPEHPYRQIMDSLKTYYTCILIHQRGSGKSRNIPINEKTISIGNYTQDIELLRKARGDRKITLLGIIVGRFARHELCSSTYRKRLRLDSDKFGSSFLHCLECLV